MEEKIRQEERERRLKEERERRLMEEENRRLMEEKIRQEERERRLKEERERRLMEEKERKLMKELQKKAEEEKKKQIEEEKMLRTKLDEMRILEIEEDKKYVEKQRRLMNGEMKKLEIEDEKRRLMEEKEMKKLKEKKKYVEEQRRLMEEKEKTLKVERDRNLLEELQKQVEEEKKKQIEEKEKCFKKNESKLSKRKKSLELEIKVAKKSIEFDDEFSKAAVVQQDNNPNPPSDMMIHGFHNISKVKTKKNKTQAQLLKIKRNEEKMKKISERKAKRKLEKQIRRVQKEERKAMKKLNRLKVEKCQIVQGKDLSVICPDLYQTKLEEINKYEDLQESLLTTKKEFESKLSGIENKIKSKKQELTAFICQKSQISSIKTTHEDISCSNCNASPIIGKRFNCLVCDEYNLCENCESKNEHTHPMIRICEMMNMNLLHKLTKQYSRRVKVKTIKKVWKKNNEKHIKPFFKNIKANVVDIFKPILKPKENDNKAQIQERMDLIDMTKGKTDNLEQIQERRTYVQDHLDDNLDSILDLENLNDLLK